MFLTVSCNGRMRRPSRCKFPRSREGGGSDSGAVVVRGAGGAVRARSARSAHTGESGASEACLARHGGGRDAGRAGRRGGGPGGRGTLLVCGSTPAREVRAPVLAR